MPTPGYGWARSWPSPGNRRRRLSICSARWSSTRRWFEAPERLAKLGDNLRGRLRRSPLMDHAWYARDLTEAFEGLVTA